jgi:hypothetical protein
LDPARRAQRPVARIACLSAKRGYQQASSQFRCVRCEQRVDPAFPISRQVAVQIRCDSPDSYILRRLGEWKACRDATFVARKRQPGESCPVPDQACCSRKLRSNFVQRGDDTAFQFRDRLLSGFDATRPAVTFCASQADGRCAAMQPLSRTRDSLETPVRIRIRRAVRESYIRISYSALNISSMGSRLNCENPASATSSRAFGSPMHAPIPAPPCASDTVMQ